MASQYPPASASPCRLDIDLAAAGTEDSHNCKSEREHVEECSDCAHTVWQGWGELQELGMVPRERCSQSTFPVSAGVCLDSMQSHIEREKMERERERGR